MSEGFSRAAWRIVASGGRWATREIVAELEAQVGVKHASSLLYDMRRSGMLEIYRQPGQPVRYGITTSCRVPPGMTVGDVMSIVMGESE